MNLRRKLYGVLILNLLLWSGTVYSQEDLQKELSIAQLFELVTENHPNLAVSKSDIEIASQDVAIAKNQYLPDIEVSTQALYIGDAAVIDKDFSNSTRVKMPHFGNVFSLDAKQLIWKGNIIQNSVEISNLKEELASLQYDSDEQNIKLLVLGYYLDLSKLYNQIDIYNRNIDLAGQRLNNIKKFYAEGMVTRNDLIRGELQIQHLNLALEVIENNKKILNNQLTVALGLPNNIQILPKEELLDQNFQISISGLPDDNLDEHPSILMAQKAIDMQHVAKKITKADRMPTLAAFAGNILQRPITTSTPAIDMYSNGWNVGLSLSFDIESLYKTPKKLRKNNLEIQRAKQQAYEVEQMIGVATHAATIKYNEALSQSQTLKKNMDLAAENYRITESKYNNQLAILLDFIDASNAKIEAELEHANAEINIIYSYYKLLKEKGKL